MRKLLNTLYVTTQGAYVHREGEALVVKREEEVVIRLPIHTLQSVVCFGRISLSPPAMQFCAEHRVLVSWLSERGEFLARVQGAVQGNVLLRRQQYRLADREESAAAMAQAMVMAKMANCRTVLQRASRERGGAGSALEEASASLGEGISRLLRSEASREQIRGIEGDAAREYFGVFDGLIVAQRESFAFRGRSRRPPLDPVNALLSFLYTLLAHDVTAALEGVGLDPYVGYLHVDRPGRPSLALDLMEELRPVLADRLVLTLINRKQVQASGFRKTEAGGVVMDESTRKTVLQAWQARKQEELRHPFLDETISWGLMPHVQALLLARHVRGDLDGYPAFVWR